MTTTRTYAILELSQPAFDEIKEKLSAAGYSDQFHQKDGALIIEMHGVAVRAVGSAVAAPTSQDWVRAPEDQQPVAWRTPIETEKVSERPGDEEPQTGADLPERNPAVR